MVAVLNIFKDFLMEEDGQTLVEWIAILALILVLIIVTIKLIGQKGKEKSEQILNELD